MLQVHKASVLAALAITDQLFQARDESQDLRKDIGTRVARLSDDVARRLDGRGLATPS
jgi:cell division protein ZapA (FtsZ GTPase activity inhibitor)